MEKINLVTSEPTNDKKYNQHKVFHINAITIKKILSPIALLIYIPLANLGWLLAITIVITKLNIKRFSNMLHNKSNEINEGHDCSSYRSTKGNPAQCIKYAIANYSKIIWRNEAIAEIFGYLRYACDYKSKSSSPKTIGNFPQIPINKELLQAFQRRLTLRSLPLTMIGNQPKTNLTDDIESDLSKIERHFRISGFLFNRVLKHKVELEKMLIAGGGNA